MTQEQTTSPDECPQEWKDAFGQMITIARRLKARGEVPEVAREYGSAVGKIGAAAGLTREETLLYSARVWLMVREEHHA